MKLKDRKPSSLGHRKSRRNSIRGHHLNTLKTHHYDHQPHDLFVQLDELQLDYDLEWRETARWIKYEENLEEGGDRWGRPHVPTLSFQSLFNLRSCLETGVVMMDVEESDLAGAAYKIVEQMVLEDVIHKEDRGAIMRVLMLRHRHVNSYAGFHFGRRKNSSHGSLLVSFHC